MKIIDESKESIFNVLSFRLKDEIPEKTDRQVKKELVEKIECILRNIHKNKIKQTINLYDDRFAFACPYCGDSTKNPRKKRANIYYSTMGFHCFNCWKHTSVHRLLEDFSDCCDILIF